MFLKLSLIATVAFLLIVILEVSMHYSMILLENGREAIKILRQIIFATVVVLWLLHSFLST